MQAGSSPRPAVELLLYPVVSAVAEVIGTPAVRPAAARRDPGVPGQSYPPVPPITPRFDIPATLADSRGYFRFGPGFELATDDGEYILQFHDLTQVDYRGYLKGNQSPTQESFGLPRQWFMWNGHVTKEIGFFVSMAQGFSTINGLDMFVDFNYDKRLQFRVGRMKTPFTYEFFTEPIQGLITPERSLFFNNFGQNRDVGIMPYGQLFDDRQWREQSPICGRHLQWQPQRVRRQPGWQVRFVIREFSSVWWLRRLHLREFQCRRLGLRRQQCPTGQSRRFCGWYRRRRATRPSAFRS